MKTIAALYASMNDGKTIAESTKLGVLAGTLQFHKSGVQLITTSELNLADI